MANAIYRLPHQSNLSGRFILGFGREAECGCTPYLTPFKNRSMNKSGRGHNQSHHAKHGLHHDYIMVSLRSRHSGLLRNSCGVRSENMFTPYFAVSPTAFSFACRARLWRNAANRRSISALSLAYPRWWSTTNCRNSRQSSDSCARAVASTTPAASRPNKPRVNIAAVGVFEFLPRPLPPDLTCWARVWECDQRSSAHKNNI